MENVRSMLSLIIQEFNLNQNASPTDLTSPATGALMTESTAKVRNLYTVQCSTAQYSTVQYSTVQYSTVQCSAVQYSAVQYSTVQCSAVQCNFCIRGAIEKFYLYFIIKGSFGRQKNQKIFIFLVYFWLKYIRIALKMKLFWFAERTHPKFTGSYEIFPIACFFKKKILCLLHCFWTSASTS